MLFLWGSEKRVRLSEETFNSDMLRNAFTGPVTGFLSHFVSLRHLLLATAMLSSGTVILMSFATSIMELTLASVILGTKICQIAFRNRKHRQLVLSRLPCWSLP